MLFSAQDRGTPSGVLRSHRGVPGQKGRCKMRCSVSVFDYSIGDGREWCCKVSLMDAHETGEMSSSFWTQEFSELQESLVLACGTLSDFIRHGSLYAKPLTDLGWSVIRPGSQSF